MITVKTYTKEINKILRRNKIKNIGNRHNIKVENIVEFLSDRKLLNDLIDKYSDENILTDVDFKDNVIKENILDYIVKRLESRDNK